MPARVKRAQAVGLRLVEVKWILALDEQGGSACSARRRQQPGQ